MIIIHFYYYCIFIISTIIIFVMAFAGMLYDFFFICKKNFICKTTIRIKKYNIWEQQVEDYIKGNTLI